MSQFDRIDRINIMETKKEDDFLGWYREALIEGQMIEYYDVSGCYILRPWSYNIWEAIQQFVDKKIKKMGVQNAYFPLFVTNKALSVEKKHIEGFAPEVAWVTKCGDKNLEEPIAIRPTSETIIYTSYAKWIRSHLNLPLKLNQWCNVVRWEFSCPMPFIRSREFLWQEGHSAFETENEANNEVIEMLDVYRQVYEDLLAVPVIKGRKTEREKFAGGLYTTTVEAFIPSAGRGIQGATSHCLGQNFSKMFDIQFEDRKKRKQYAWQNSWGITTRTIGVMVMIHGDDRGLVLPPKVAPLQVIIIPIYYQKDKDTIIKKAKEIKDQIENNNIRVDIDLRENHKPGRKFYHWETKGVPLRLEFGPKDLLEEKVTLIKRYNGEKLDIKWTEMINKISDLLEDIHQSMYRKAEIKMKESILICETMDEYIKAIELQCLAKVPLCADIMCEDNLKGVNIGQGHAKSLCIPFNDNSFAPFSNKCISCEKIASSWVLFGKSY